MGNDISTTVLLILIQVSIVELQPIGNASGPGIIAGSSIKSGNCEIDNFYAWNSIYLNI